MTHTEAADLIRLASYSCLDDDSKTAALNAIIPAVITVMDAARADALEEAANICGTLAETTYDEADGFMAVLGCEAAIRALAQSHREPKP